MTLSVGGSAGAPMLSDALDSLNDVVSPPLRRVLVKSLTLTLAILLLAWFALDALSLSMVSIGAGWLLTILHIAIGLGLFLALALLAAPTVSLVAGFFLDEIAAYVEGKIYPGGRQGRAAPALDSVKLTLAFAPIALAVSALALVLLFVPGFGFAAWIAANAYVLGREYFELCALRFNEMAGVQALRRANRLAVFVYGLPIALLVAVPGLNLATPLYATALMTRLVKRLPPIQDDAPSRA